MLSVANFLFQLVNLRGRYDAEFEFGYRRGVVVEGGDDGVVAEVTAAARDDDEIAGLELLERLRIRE